MGQCVECCMYHMSGSAAVPCCGKTCCTVRLAMGNTRTTADAEERPYMSSLCTSAVFKTCACERGQPRTGKHSSLRLRDSLWQRIDSSSSKQRLGPIKHDNHQCATIIGLLRQRAAYFTFEHSSSFFPLSPRERLYRASQNAKHTVPKAVYGFHERSKLKRASRGVRTGTWFSIA